MVQSGAFEPSAKVINGYGDAAGLTGPELAIYRFYRAFNEKDIVAMSNIWANSEDVTAQNPAGGIRRGWSDLQWVYERVLRSSAKVSAEFYDYTIHLAAEVFWAVGRERIILGSGEHSEVLFVRITRIFRMIGGEWRLVHLHGSFEDPEMLLKYQQVTGSGVAGQSLDPER